MPVAVRISSPVWLRAELPRQRRFIAGTGIGGEYAAINSAIDEMTPAKYRSRVDIGVNGRYWVGSIIGTLAALLETQYFAGPFQAPPWRVALAEPIPPATDEPMRLQGDGQRRPPGMTEQVTLVRPGTERTTDCNERSVIS